MKQPYMKRIYSVYEADVIHQSVRGSNDEFVATPVDYIRFKADTQPPLHGCEDLLKIKSFLYYLLCIKVKSFHEGISRKIFIQLKI